MIGLSLSRRAFLAASALAPFAALAPRAHTSPFAPGTHPEPRPGITAAKVLQKAQLADAPRAVAAFDLVREIPHVVDGIRCGCGCAEEAGSYSLLSCFEGEDAMAKHCEVCQTHARLVHRLHKAGKSLAEIRKAVDARFG